MWGRVKGRRCWDTVVGVEGHSGVRKYKQVKYQR